LEVRDQLVRLLKIQQLALEVQQARGIIEGAPARIGEIEQRFRDRNAEYVSLKDRFEELEQDRRRRSFELDQLEQARKKYMDALMQVTNQREYSAVLKEIDTVKAAIGEHEEAILKAMEECERLKKELDARASHIEQERAVVEREREQVERQVAAARERIAHCEEERARLEGELPRDLVETVRRIEESRRGLFLARTEDATCSACHVRVRPQVFQEIRQASRIHTCSQCKRILYVATALEPAPGPDSSAEGAVEARNGGAV
jgi:hypothetical protein